MLERQARDLEVQGLNLGPGSNFSLEFEFSLSPWLMVSGGSKLRSQELAYNAHPEPNQSNSSY